MIYKYINPLFQLILFRRKKKPQKISNLQLFDIFRKIAVHSKQVDIFFLITSFLLRFILYPFYFSSLFEKMTVF